MKLVDIREEILKGCGLQETYWKSSLCKKGNLCEDCSIKLEYYDKGHYEGYDQACEHFIEFLELNKDKDKIVCKICGKKGTGMFSLDCVCYDCIKKRTKKGEQLDAARAI